MIDDNETSIVPFEKVRDEYDDPVSKESEEAQGDCYCVGGAFVRAHLGQLDECTRRRVSNRFPHKLHLTRVFEQVFGIVDPRLKVRARNIVDLNDSGHIERSWEEMRLLYEKVDAPIEA